MAVVLIPCSELAAAPAAVSRRYNRESVTRLRLILSNLGQVEGPEEMNLPGLGLHEFKGNREGAWMVKVSGNWCERFRFAGHDAETVNY